MIEVVSIKRTNGVAGQIAYAATAKIVSYDAQVVGEAGEPDNVAFVGSLYGGPVVMVLPTGQQVFVTDPGRFGKFGPQWVRNFFQEATGVQLD